VAGGQAAGKNKSFKVCQASYSELLRIRQQYPDCGNLPYLFVSIFVGTRKNSPPARGGMAAASADEVVGASAMSPQGEMRSATQHLRYDIVDKQDESTGLSAMMRTTAFPASIIAQMMDKFVAELERRSIRIAVSDGG